MSGNDGACPQMEVDEADEEEEEEEINFSGQDLMKIRDAVVLLVQSLLRLLQRFTLKDKPHSANHITQVTTSPPRRPLCVPLRCNLFVPCPQIFSKLLYFEPVVGELTFAAVR